MQPLLQWKSNMYYIFSVCVCNLRYPARNTHAPYCHPWPVRRYSIFSTLSHKLHDFREKKKLSNIQCVFRFSLRLLSETFLIPRRTARAIIKNGYCSSCKVPVILVILSRNFNVFGRFSKNTQIRNFIKIRPMGAELFNSDGETWRS